MIKVERMENGFMIEMDGANGDLIEEIAQAAAAYHVRTIKVREKKEIDNEDAIKGSVFLFGIVMADAMRKQLGAEYKEEKTADADFKVIPLDLKGKKGGVVQ